jgi:dynein heavy chain 1
LNSVLDDSRLLTLPNGERLSLPSNVRIMFEVDTLKYATLATVSRCGMVWFSEDVISLDMLFDNYIADLSAIPRDEEEEAARASVTKPGDGASADSDTLKTQRIIADILKGLFVKNSMVEKVLEFASGLEHIMDFTRMRVISTLFSLLNKTVRNILEYNSNHMDFPMTQEHLETYISKRLAVGLVWSFAGDAKLERRAELGRYISTLVSIEMPPVEDGGSLIDYDVELASGEWFSWQSKVPVTELSAASSVTASDIVIPTIDTIRHEEVLYSWLSEHKPLLLCGPPGSVYSIQI